MQHRRTHFETSSHRIVQVRHVSGPDPRVRLGGNDGLGPYRLPEVVLNSGRSVQEHKGSFGNRARREVQPGNIGLGSAHGVALGLDRVGLRVGGRAIAQGRGRAGKRVCLRIEVTMGDSDGNRQRREVQQGALYTLRLYKPTSVNASQQNRCTSSCLFSADLLFICTCVSHITIHPM